MSARRALFALVALAAVSACGASGAAAPATPTSSAIASSPSLAERQPSPDPTPDVAVVPSVNSAAAVPKNRQAAEALIARKPGKLGIVVRDRVTGAVWRAGATRDADWTGSTIKLAIATALLERQRAGQIVLDATDRANLTNALVNSSNDAATALWNKYNGPSMLERFRVTYGMSSLSVVPGYDTFWRNLRCTAEDLQALMSYVLDKLTGDDRSYLVTTLRGVAGNQHWGVWAAGAALHPGNKDGWAQKPDDGVTHWITHSVGFAGDGERYVVAVTYRLPASSSLADGVHAVSDLVATVFGARLPATVTIP